MKTNTPHTGSVPEITVAWLKRLRWVAVLGQLSAGALSFWFGWEVSVWLLLLVAFLTASTNQVFFRVIAPSRLSISLVLALDIVLLTVLLAAAGGSSNPFSLLYLINITLAAVILDPRLTWLLSALAMVCYGLLFLLPSTSTMHHGDHEAFSLHLYGMWLAFSLTAMALAYFVAQVSKALAAREAELTVAREQATRAERLASLSTLAAGAAHELSTPLATIAVCAKELERLAANASITEEAQLIREEVERCRAILIRMRAQAGESVGEAPVLVSLEALRAEVLEILGPKLSAGVRFMVEPSQLKAPKRALAQALVNLIRNGLDASQDIVEVTAQVSAETIQFEVVDQGAPLSAEVLVRAGEPFFTTKPPGHGMGLGLFLTHNFAAMLSGKCWLESTDRGTKAALQLPRCVS
jgi:two-component system, sensor histidine kinase RegB